MPTLDKIRRSLIAYDPHTIQVDGKRHAAVAIVLRDGDHGPDVLFIERATREGDPWSGHMAFPGGRMDDEDRDARAVAERETEEEVGVDLRRAEILGRIDDLEGHHAAASKMVISAFTYYVEQPGPLVLQDGEVREAFWFPLRSLRDPELHVDYPMRRFGLGNYPGILVGRPERHIVWGLTYKFLEVLLSVVGHPLPDRWADVPLEARPPQRR